MRSGGNRTSVTPAEMTDALGQINDRLARGARASELSGATFYCECGSCLAEHVTLSLEEHDEIRAREELIFAPGHELRPSDRMPQRVSSASTPRGSMDFVESRLVRIQHLIRTAVRD